MKRPGLLTLISVNLLALLALAFIYPQFMISPGALSRGHSALATDCFACHALGRGASSQRCMSCHEPSQIGLRTTKGLPIVRKSVAVAFHQQLMEPNCVICHSDHEAPKLTRRDRKPFSHELLVPAARQRCEQCHQRPNDLRHRSLSMSCSQCHQPPRWQGARFEHRALPQATLDHCESCHQAPTDTLHHGIAGQCQRCHSPAAWKPANYDHATLFPLTGEHDVSCETCHTNANFDRYTCYGCHEHSPDRVRAQHREEGIVDLDNCVRCHRSGGEGEGGDD